MPDVEFVNESLARLGEALSAFGDNRPERGTGAWLMYQSLLTRQTELLEERATLAGDHQVEVNLVGSPVVGHTIDSRFLGVLLERFQDSVTAVTQTLMGEARSRGAWGEDVLSTSRMMVTATAPGSFVLALRGPDRAHQPPLAQLDTEADVEPPVFDEALGLVLNVLEAANDDMDSTRLLESASEAGARAVKHLDKLANEVASNSVVAKIVHRASPGEDPRRVQFGYSAARRMQQVFAQTDTREETLVVSGRLVGASWVRHRFELESEDPEGQQVVYRGTVNVDLRGQIQSAFDSQVRATLEKTSIKGELDEEPAVSWHLIDVELIG